MSGGGRLTGLTEKVLIDTVIGDVSRLNKGEGESGRPIDTAQAQGWKRSGPWKCGGQAGIVGRPGGAYRGDGGKPRGLISQQGTLDPEVIERVPQRRFRPWIGIFLALIIFFEIAFSKVNAKAADKTGVSAELLQFYLQHWLLCHLGLY